MKRRVHVRVSPNGEITVDAEGFRGKDCEAATKAIEEALGKTKNRTRKPHYWRQEVVPQNRQQLGGT